MIKCLHKRVQNIIDPQWENTTMIVVPQVVTTEFGR